MSEWQSYTATVTQHTVTGDLRVLRDVYSPQLDNYRDVLAWLPPAYEQSERAYPVIYMHDAQNLFDAHTSYSGEWRVDETMTQLAQEGLEAIIIGLPNMKEKRAVEYSPYPFRMNGTNYRGEGDEYIQFIAETVKPLIDRTFRTRADSAATGIVGSSMGGLISLYGFLMRPDIFGLCGAFSPAYWFGQSGLVKTVRQHARGTGRVYLDVGTREGPTLANWAITADDLHTAYAKGVRVLHEALLDGGYKDGQNLRYVEAEGAIHNEAAWAERFPDAMRFLLAELAC